MYPIPQLYKESRTTNIGKGIQQYLSYNPMYNPSFHFISLPILHIGGNVPNPYTQMSLTPRPYTSLNTLLYRPIDHYIPPHRDFERYWTGVSVFHILQMRANDCATPLSNGILLHLGILVGFRVHGPGNLAFVRC